MWTVPQEFKPGQNESRVLFDEHKQEVCVKLSSKEDVWISNLCIENRLLQCKACKRLMEAAALKHWCSWSAITHHYPEEFSSWATFSYSRRMNRFLCSFASDTVSPVWFHGILSKRIKKKKNKKNRQKCFFGQYSCTAVSSCSHHKAWTDKAALKRYSWE